MKRASGHGVKTMSGPSNDPRGERMISAQIPLAFGHAQRTMRRREGETPPRRRPGPGRDRNRAEPEAF